MNQGHPTKDQTSVSRSQIMKHETRTGDATIESCGMTASGNKYYILNASSARETSMPIDGNVYRLKRDSLTGSLPDLTSMHNKHCDAVNPDIITKGKRHLPEASSTFRAVLQQLNIEQNPPELSANSRSKKRKAKTQNTNGCKSRLDKTHGTTFPKYLHRDCLCKVSEIQKQTDTKFKSGKSSEKVLKGVTLSASQPASPSLMRNSKHKKASPLTSR